MRLRVTQIHSPIGLIHTAVGPQGLCGLEFTERWQARLGRLERRFGDLELETVADPGEIASRLRAYFAGHLHALDRFPVDPGVTSFQTKVLAAVRKIPAAETRSYGELAHALGKPTGARAVAAAVAKNPISIVIPCHRVIGSTGHLTGYAGGLPRKRWLLAHEGALTTGDSDTLPLVTSLGRASRQ